MPDDMTTPNMTPNEASRHTGADCRLKKVHGIVAHAYKQVKYRQAKQEDDDAKIDGFHLIELIIYDFCAKL